MTIVVKKVPKFLRGVVKVRFGIKEETTKKELQLVFLYQCVNI